MINVESFSLKNVVHFVKAEVPVTDNNGFVIVSGWNKDSRIADDQNNGAGKSLLWGAFPNCMYAAAPSSTLKNTKKEMLDSSKSEISVKFLNNNGLPVNVVQKPSKWLIHEYDQSKDEMIDTKARTGDIQKAKIAEHFPLTIDEFYAYTYLSSIQGQRTHFQKEKPADRLKFITSVFHLDSYDKLKKYFTGMLARIKDEQTKFDVLENKLLTTTTQLKKLDWKEEDAAKAKKAKKKFDKLKKERDKIARSLNELEQIGHTLKRLKRLIKERDELFDGFPDKPIESVLSSLKSRREVVREYEAYEKQRASYERSTLKIRQKLDTLLESLEGKSLPPIKKLQKKLDSVREKCDDLENRLDEAEQTYERSAKLEKTIKQLSSQLRDLGYDKPKDVDMDTDIDDDMSICKTTLRLRKLLDSDVDSECPTCHQHVDMKKITKNVKKAEKKLEKLKSLSRARDITLTIKGLRKELKEIDSSESVGDLKAELAPYLKERSTIEVQIRVKQRIQELEENLEAIEVPEEPERKPKKNDTLSKLQDKIEVCRELQKLNASISDILDSNPALAAAEDDMKGYMRSCKEKHDHLESQLSSIDAKYKKIMRFTSDFDRRLGEYRILSKQKLELEAEMEKIKPLLAKRDMYKALEKAYGKQGLKVHKANEILRLLEENMNRYSNLIFAEPFEFHLYANEKGVFCEVDRGTGKKTDVRLLSGAESGSFQLLFMVSLLLLVPSARRVNFVVLDEPDSHMDSSTRALLAERFIPFLREVVPHVFLITPGDRDVFRDYEHWQIIKKDGVSKLKRNAVG